MNTVSFSLDEITAHEYQESVDDSPMLLLSEAEIILGQDAETSKVFVVEGKEALHSVIQDVNHEPVNVVVVKLNRKSDELRQLQNIIALAKSRS